MFYNNLLKSDHIGIEISLPCSQPRREPRLKSDHIGIEIGFEETGFKTIITLKSDHIGIEIGLWWNTGLHQRITKIRPYWDWNPFAKYVKGKGTRSLKSDHIGIEI